MIRHRMRIFLVSIFAAMLTWHLAFAGERVGTWIRIGHINQHVSIWLNEATLPPDHETTNDLKSWGFRAVEVYIGAGGQTSMNDVYQAFLTCKGYGALRPYLSQQPGTPSFSPIPEDSVLHAISVAACPTSQR